MDGGKTDSEPVAKAEPQVTVWLIDPYRAGERSQVLALAAALPWPYEVKRLQYRRFAGRTNLLRGSDLDGLRAECRAQLHAPWPDLLITAGMRNEPVCRWVREQSAGRTRIVHVGRPWADPERFDLVVTTPQYRLPQRAEVLHNELTMHGITVDRLATAAASWRPRLGDLAPPYLSLILGGDSGPYTFGAHAARRLAGQANALANRLGASLLVTTSSRTRPAATDALEAALQQPYQIYRWQAGDTENPYLAYLGLADELIVTADSISMLSEACASGRPVHMFDLNTGTQGMHAGSLLEHGRNDFRLTAYLYRGLMRWGPRRLSRDICLIHQGLIDGRLACWLGEEQEDWTPTLPRDLPRAAARVVALMQLSG